jgi:hypothetical protein
MNVVRKIIFSLLISALIFAVFAAAAFTGLFDFVEARFYNPRVLGALNREVMKDAGLIGGLLDELRDRFSIVVGEEAVRRSFLPNQAEEDAFERGRIFGSLLNSLPGLRSVRFVDAGGGRIHFSTLAEDALGQGGSSLVYRAYPDCPGVLPYSEVEAAEGAAPRLIFDGPGEQLIFSYPFTDTLDVYRGSALFTFSVRAVAERMVEEGRILVGEDVSVVSSPGGFLLGLPALGREGLKSQAAGVWGGGNPGLSVLDGEDAESLALISAAYGYPEQKAAGEGSSKTGTVFVGRLVGERLFIFPPLMRFVLLGSFFLTVFLLVFLLFNLRQDSVTVVNSRLGLIRNGLIQQYAGQKRPMDWKHWARELEQRRGEIRAELKRDLPRRKNNSPLEAKIDALIDLSWDEVVSAVGNYPPGKLDEKELRALIADVLRRSGGLLPGESVIPAAGPAEEIKKVDEGEKTRWIEGAERTEKTERLGPEAEPDLLEELEELEAVEEPADKPAPSRDGEQGAGPSSGLAEAEDEEVLEELEELKEPDEGRASGEIVITPETFEAEPEADLEPLEDAPVQGPADPEDLDALASRIEFGPDGETGEEDEGEILRLEMASPLDSLSFESPSFSVDDEKNAGFPAGNNAPELKAGPGESFGENRKKKQQTDGVLKDSSLMEITGDGGLPFIYQPFLFRGNSKPLPLRPLEDQTPEPIRERDGIHQVNSDILDPKLENSGHLDPQFLRLVESILGSKA